MKKSGFPGTGFSYYGKQLFFLSQTFHKRQQSFLSRIAHEEKIRIKIITKGRMSEFKIFTIHLNIKIIVFFLFFKVININLVIT